MSPPLAVLTTTPKIIGVAADHEGFELKEYLVAMLGESGHGVIDFGDGPPKLDDDYPDFVVPLALAVARGDVNRALPSAAAEWERASLRTKWPVCVWA
jgi:Ribose/Galactose Isomerase